MKKTSLFLIAALLLALTACQSADTTPTQETERAGDTLAPSPTPAPAAWFTPDVDANCRIGPSVMYPILAVLTPGAEYQVFGINEDASWLFINTELTQCWVKLTTGQASGEVHRMPFVAYGPVPPPPPEMAGGSDAGEGSGSGSEDSGGSGLVVDPGLVLPIDPVYMVPLYPSVLCGLYTGQVECEAHGCTWVPPKLDICGNPPMPCGFTPGYCTN